MIRLHIRAPGGEGGGQQRLRVEVAPDATLLFLSCTLAARHLAACPPAGFRLSLNRRDAIGTCRPPRRCAAVHLSRLRQETRIPSSPPPKRG